jgi:3-dehydroquinate synthetase
LEYDFFEKKSLRRIADFGHTFSTFIEEKSRYAINHGYAVAMDMLLCVWIAEFFEQISTDTATAYTKMFLKFSLIKQAHIDFITKYEDALYEHSADRLIKHRGGDFNCVIPVGDIGHGGFINFDGCHDLSSNNYALIIPKTRFIEAYHYAAGKVKTVLTKKGDV